METTTQETTAIQRTIDISLSPDELRPYIDDAYRAAQSNISLKGFRKGRTPVSLIRKMYGPTIENEAVEKAINESFVRYAEEHEVKSVSAPVIVSVDRREDGGVDYRVLYETMPEFELKDYKGLHGRRIYHTVTEEEVDSELERLRERQMEVEDAEEVLDESYVATIDLQKLDEDGTLIIGDVTPGIRVVLRRPQVNEDLRRKLIGTKVGDTFPVALPTGEGESMLDYEATVRHVARATVPELDDAFARQLLDDEEGSMEELRSVIRDNITAAYDEQYRKQLRDELIGTLMADYEFEVPATFVYNVLQQFEDELKEGPDGTLPEDYDQKEYFERMRPFAERTARWALVRDRIREREDLRAEDHDYEGLAQIEAQRMGIDPSMLLQYLKNAKEIEDRIIAEKVMQLIEDYAIVEDVEDTEVAARAPASSRSSAAGSAPDAAGRPASETEDHASSPAESPGDEYDVVADDSDRSNADTEGDQANESNAADNAPAADNDPAKA